MEVIVYDNIEDKNEIETKINLPLSSHESLVHTLNLMDFMAAFKKPEIIVEDHIDWIVLERKAHDTQ